MRELTRPNARRGSGRGEGGRDGPMSGGRAGMGL